MKKILFLSLCLLFFTVVAFAQTKKFTLTIATATNKAQTVTVYDDGVLDISGLLSRQSYGPYEGLLQKDYLGKDESGNYQYTNTYTSEDSVLRIIHIHKLTAKQFLEGENEAADGKRVVLIRRTPKQVYVNDATTEVKQSYFLHFKSVSKLRQYLRAANGLPSGNARTFTITLKNGEKRTLKVLGKALNPKMYIPAYNPPPTYSDEFTYLHKNGDTYTHTVVTMMLTTVKIITTVFSKSDVKGNERTNNSSYSFIRLHKEVSKHICEDGQIEQFFPSSLIHIGFASEEEAVAFEKELVTKP